MDPESNNNDMPGAPTPQVQMTQGRGKGMKWLVMVIVAVIIAGLGFGGGWLLKQQSDSSKSSSTSTQETSKLLFVLKGRLTVVGDKLAILDNSVEWFTDHPEHKAGVITPSAFLDAWNSSDLKQNPPNAAFSDSGVVVELSDATLTEGGSLEFSYKLVSGTLASGTVEGAAMFIDALPTPVNGQAQCDIVNCQITDSVTKAGAATCDIGTISSWKDVVTNNTYPDNGVTCDQRKTLVTSFLDSIQPIEAGALSYSTKADFPEANTDWTCEGSAVGANPSILVSTKCMPTDTTLQSQYGFDLFGQTVETN